MAIVTRLLTLFAVTFGFVWRQL